nr:MBL fold metallo-hydrolase [Alcaligenes sp. HPC1271]
MDPGQAAPVLDWLERESLQLDAILLTHHHGDHVGGVMDILARHPARVWGPPTSVCLPVTCLSASPIRSSYLLWN